MSMAGLEQALEKMHTAGVGHVPREVFAHYYAQLETGATGLVPEDSIRPLLDPPALKGVQVDEDDAREAIRATVVIKLNGGLGTSMGMDKAKSLLRVRKNASFLDVIVRQIRCARSQYDARLPLLLMNSFRTRADSLAALDAYPDLAVPGLPRDFLQNKEPKLLVEGLTPASWPQDPSLEWCPPGHGDIYPALLETGILQRLLEAGFRYATTSNADNLGAAPNARLAGWFAASGAPYAAELCRRTAADRKGGHLAIRKADGRLILRDTAQTPPQEMSYFTDEHRHPFFHTNNLWFDLRRLHEKLTQSKGVLPLPMIRNVKHLDPTRPDSPKVYQIETALGSAIEVFDGSQAIVVGRDRFLPVKTTNDLLTLRSDAYRDAPDGTLALVPPTAPLIDLDPTHYATINSFEARFPDGPPSLRDARSLTVRGDWTFGLGVTVTGDAVLDSRGGPATVPDGTRLGDDTRKPR